MSKFLQRVLVCGALILLPMAMTAQQVPNSDFEDWSGTTFDGEAQPKGWNASNVEQVGMKFNFAHKETGHGNKGYCLMVQDQDVGAMGITETSPGYFSLGHAWVYLPSITQISQASAGTYGGMSWTYRPDSMSVWIKRTGSNWSKEDFYLLYYSWTGTAKSNKYKGKNGSCSTTDTFTDEESDIRLALDGNECGTNQKATQVAEGMWRERAQYNQWTNIRVPIYYMNNSTPQKVNIMFSASNYPNFRANDGLYTGNSLYVDDVELIYSSKIQKLYIDDMEWKGFDPNSTAVQYYAMGETATAIPSKIEAIRGAGSLTNAHGTTVNFAGRKLSGSEITIENGNLTDKPTKITVKSEDGKSTTVYLIQFQRAASSNAKLAGISINGEPLSGFSPTKYNYNVDLPYGTTAAPVIAAEGQEDKQTIAITQPTSVNGTATINVTAANGSSKATYTLNFKVGLLADNELQDILVNGKSVPGFTPSQTVYKVSLPVGTTTMPTVKGVSKYPDGEQTIAYNPPATIDGGQYTVSVTTPGNQIAKVYKLNFKLEASSYTYLKNLQVAGGYIKNYQPDNFTYYINLPLGTTAIPEITFEKGDEYQTVAVSQLGEGVLDGTVRVTVTAGNGDQSVYKLVFSTEKSDNSSLNGITIGGVALEGFDPNTYNYTYNLPVGTTELPAIVAIPGDEFQKIAITTAGLNGKTRITVTAGDGSTSIYLIAFSVQTFSENTLASLTVAGFDINFAPETNEYWVNLPQGTTTLPEVTYTLKDANFQTASVRTISGLTGDYKITVRPQSGASRTYVIHFSVATSSNVNLAMIYVGGTALEGFAANKLNYTITLPEGVSKIPAVTFDKAEASQRVLSVLDGKVQTITVTAQSGATQTYTVTFIVTVSENAFLDMIYLDSVPLAGFVKTNLTYSVQLESATCPQITVDKAPGQQVTITAPYAAGTAQIQVQPEQGTANTYEITFTTGAAASVRLQGITIDGVAIDGFAPTTLAYTANYTGSLPVVAGVVADPSQTVEVLWKGEVASLHVSDAEGNRAVYTVTFTRQLLSNKTLKSILIDGVAMTEFETTKLNYTRTLPAGSTYPEVSYVANDNAQVIFFGQLAEGKWGITVAAEDGTTATYTVTFTIKKYNDATLADLKLDGTTIAGFAPTTYNYTLTIDEGATLPQLTVTTREGQTVVINNTDDSHQQVIVYAESGATNTYVVTYNRQLSSNALLANILIDGVGIEGFAPNKTEYTDTIAWRSKFVPNVYPVGQLPNQTITTYYSRPNGVTKIHVKAQDGTTKDYTIAFPIRKSSNTALGDLYLDSEDAEIKFKASVTDYEVVLPFSTTKCPQIVYEKAEPEQRIDVISRPIGQTSQIIVVAENGDTRTYNILFKREVLKTKNLLSSITVRIDNNEELDQVLNLKDKTKRDFEIDVPFGSRSLTVVYEKSYEAQTVFVQPGGVHNPTIITVKANNDTVADEIYRIIPTLPTADPATLSDIKVNNVTISGFNPEKFSYIVPVTEKPKLRYTLNKGAEINIIYQSTKHWQAEVTYGDRTNTYDVWYYYTNEQIPNADFNDWTACAKLTSAQKPTNWNTIADVLGKHSGFGSFTPNTLVSKPSNGIVELQTQYSTPGGGMIPGFITLGNVSGNWGVAGSSSFGISGGIPFHNSPDEITFRYKLESVSTNNQIQYILTGIDGTTTLEWNESATSSSYKDYKYSLAAANQAAGDPTTLNILINSYKQIDGTIVASGANMLVDKITVSYNHTLTGLKVDDINATMTGNAFSATLKDPERIELPVLSFTGEVADQAQNVTWKAPTKDANYETRTATIRNFAENGTDYTDYTLTVKRPLDTKNELANLLIDTVQVTGFATNKTDYTITLPISRRNLPDVQPVPGSSLQTVTTVYNAADSTVTITVTPEKGTSTVYTVKFKSTVSNDATLSSITTEDGALTYNPDQHSYQIEAEQWPLISFVKKSDLQEVTLNNGVITVKAEDGTVGTYTITRVNPTITPNGLIKEFAQGDNVITGFGNTNYTKTESKPAEAILFTRQQDADSVIFVQTETNMTWTVPGSGKTYTWTFQTEASHNAKLAQILLDGANYDDFDPNYSEEPYTIYSDTTLLIDAIGAEAAQQIKTTQTEVHEGVVEGVEYTFEVTAEDGTTKKSYDVRVLRPKNSSALLAGILLDDVLIDGFDPATTSYTVTLPLPADGIKRAEPQLPNVTYIAGHQGQTVTVEPGTLGNPTNITVVSEDKSDTKYYDLTITSEKSHCSDLSGIIVNGEALDHFESGRHYYSISLKTDGIEIDYTSNDRFQTVQKIIGVIKAGHQYSDTLRVTAEDGSTSDYIVDIYIENQSNDATLANILLDGQKFVDFERAINEDLAFDPGQNSYVIYLPSGTTVLPEVSAQLKMDGQTVDINQVGDSVLLTVHAMDNSTNQYVLHFVVPLSKNANLSMIFLDGEPLASFDPNYYFYQVTLPVGTHTLPEVVAQKDEEVQTILPIEMDLNKLQATIKVQAEDKTVRENTYVVVFRFTQSDADTLAMIYQDGKPLDGYQPTHKYYALSLPVGTAAFPDLSWEEADEWQTVTMDTVEFAADKLIRQIVVTSESGKKNFYTVSYTILKSTIDTLQMIFVDQKQLAGFNANTLEYYYELTAAYAAELDGQVPLVEYISGDEYQTVLVSQVRDSISGKSLGYKSIVTVTAATGASRTYTIHYPVQKSSEATLNMIYLAGKPLANYDAERFVYKVEIDAEASVPVITVLKKEDIQVVEISIDGDVVTIVVTAEDGSNQTYTLTFVRLLSAITTLRDIVLTDANGEVLPATQFPFRPEEFSYTINLPYTATMTISEQLPTIETVTYDPLQKTDTTYYLLENGDVRVDITVTAPNGEDQAVYSLIFHFLKPTDATLVNILLKDEELAGFLPSQTEYTYVHPYGSDTTDFFTTADVEVLLSDKLATYTITQNEEGTLFIRVVAQDGKTEITYIIMQIIGKDSNCFLSLITLDGDTIEGFDSNVTFYTYYLREGATTTPVVDAIPESENAEVSIREVSAGDTCMIICTAADGSVMRYYVYFAISSINESLEPTGNDVVIKRLPGTNQLFVGTIRKDVYFLLMDENGRNLVYELIPTADPNDAQIVDDLELGARLNDITDSRSGLVIDVNPGQLYFYSFLYGDKTIIQMFKGDTAKKLKSGKIICQ